MQNLRSLTTKKSGWRQAALAIFLFGCHAHTDSSAVTRFDSDTWREVATQEVAKEKEAETIRTETHTLPAETETITDIERRMPDGGVVVRIHRVKRQRTGETTTQTTDTTHAAQTQDTQSTNKSGGDTKLKTKTQEEKTVNVGCNFGDWIWTAALVAVLAAAAIWLWRKGWIGKAFKFFGF